MSVSAVSGSVQLYPQPKFQPSSSPSFSALLNIAPAPVNSAPNNDDGSQAAAVQNQQNSIQAQQVAQVQQVQNQNDNQISINFLA